MKELSKIVLEYIIIHLVKKCYIINIHNCYDNIIANYVHFKLFAHS